MFPEDEYYGWCYDMEDTANECRDLLRSRIDIVMQVYLSHDSCGVGVVI